MDRNQLAHTLARFYIAYKAVIPFLECLVIKEVEVVGMFQCMCYYGNGLSLFCMFSYLLIIVVRTENMFRGNSLASKCFDHFMKVN